MSKFVFLLLGGAVLYAQERPIVLKTSTMFDGKGKMLRNTIIVIEGSKITRVGGAAPAGAVTYDLTPFTVSPGWIDTHTHLSYHFDNSDRYAGRDEPPDQALLHIADNLVRTIEAGFTTVQSPRAPIDKELRDATVRGTLPGPRVLTSNSSGSASGRVPT
jgi:imidazolonepropionase-like amidohydrolase